MLFVYLRHSSRFVPPLCTFVDSLYYFRPFGKRSPCTLNETVIKLPTKQKGQKEQNAFSAKRAKFKCA